ncbi:MAG: hypothetical protein ACLFVU_02155 [Phycisphaerae bacterium]
METQYQLRTTIAVPESLISGANQLALVLGESPADDRTFGTPRWQDEDGNLYAVSSTVAKPVFAENASKPLEAPDFAPDADIEAATHAQDVLKIEDRTNGSDPVAANPDHIAVIIDDRFASAREHIESMGLSSVPREDDDLD